MIATINVASVDRRSEGLERHCRDRRRPFDDRVAGKVKEFAPKARYIAHVDVDAAELGKVKSDLKHETDRTAWFNRELDRASSRSALLPVAMNTGLRPVDPAQIVSLPEDYLVPGDARMRETGSSTLLASAARALQSLVPDAAARGRHVN